MTKRIVLATLMLLVGGLTSLSLEGLLLGLPLLLGGTYLTFEPHVPVGRFERVSFVGSRS